jgi:hypothetical protein
MTKESTRAVGAPLEREVRHHEWDDDGCCLHCNFDGAEWHWWKNSTYEGRAQPYAKQPLCIERQETALERRAKLYL